MTGDELLSVDLATSGLPAPCGLTVTPCGNRLRLTIAFDTVQAARQWAQALGVSMHDTDPQHRYQLTRQESGSSAIGLLRLQLIGTEHADAVAA